ncbi:superoxide dismutase 1 [Tritrichomonas foetus]|uniref:Superoxide dismutase n=1 Tax=Tritrichomonas foetus TaxID=1144522 RepID=A0A1J4J999_9EUKA|nr:superoxide dismutase 1 [Tritrichomonas foetus]|eukprot:OHS94823.1 superoxide dismutase 1 [Tritrichomonas foetus]
MFVIPFIPYLVTGIKGFLTRHQLEVHVLKHHQAYVNYLNTHVPGTIYSNMSLEEIVEFSDGTMFNNAGQHFNHNFFWKSLTGVKQTIPVKVESFIIENFGSVDQFKKLFTGNASTIFGSGWCYLEYDRFTNKVAIAQYSNANNPIRYKKYPILCVDTWEHAWYIDYENRKAEYFAKFWDACNWEFLGENLEKLNLV